MVFRVRFVFSRDSHTKARRARFTLKLSSVDGHTATGDTKNHTQMHTTIDKMCEMENGNSVYTRRSREAVRTQFRFVIFIQLRFGRRIICVNMK